MVNNNRMPHDSPELREVLMGFLDSASSLCDMMNTTMAAVLNEVMSIQADEACGAGYGERSDARVNSRNGYRERRLETTVGTLPLQSEMAPADLSELWGFQQCYVLDFPNLADGPSPGPLADLPRTAPRTALLPCLCRGPGGCRRRGMVPCRGSD
jgi:hypothetical protein